MKCSKCGNELPNGSSFCTVCGNKIDAKSMFYTVKDDSPAEESAPKSSFDIEPVRPESVRSEPPRYEPSRPEPPRYEPPRYEPPRYEPPRPEGITIGTDKRGSTTRIHENPPYGTYPATSVATAAPKKLGKGAIIAIVGAVILALVVGFLALRFFAKDPIVGTWTATEIVENGMSYDPAVVFEANLKATFGDNNTMYLEQVGINDSTYDDTISGNWDKVGKGEYSVTIYGDFGDEATSAVHVKGKTLIWDGVGSSYITFKK